MVLVAGSVGRYSMIMNAKDIIADASARRDAALAEAKRWSDFIAMTEELYGAPSLVIARAQTVGDTHQPGKRDFSGATLLITQEAATAAIREAGRPLPTRELLTALERRGVPVGGKDPASTLSARLSRAPGLINVRPHGWDVKESSEEDVTSEPPERENSEATNQTPDSADEDGREVEHNNMNH